MVSSHGWYFYQRTTYQMLSSVPICLMVLSTGYLALSVLSLRDSQSGEGSGKCSWMCFSVFWCRYRLER